MYNTFVGVFILFNGKTMSDHGLTGALLATKLVSCSYHPAVIQADWSDQSKFAISCGQALARSVLKAEVKKKKQL